MFFQRGYKSVVLLMVVIITSVASLTAQDADYPEEPIVDVAYIRGNFPISTAMVGYRDGLYLIRFENNSGRDYFGVDVWGYYPIQRVRYEDDFGNPLNPPEIVPDTRWALGRYGWLRSYEISVLQGVTYLEFDANLYRLAYNNRTSPWVMGSWVNSSNTYLVVPGALAPIEQEYPLFPEVNFNVVTPQPTTVIPTYCFDFIILISTANQYQIWRESTSGGADQLIQSGSVTFGADFEWFNTTGGGGRFYLLIDGTEYIRKYCN